MSSYRVSVTNDRGRADEFEFSKEIVTVGRSKKRDITIGDDAVSGKHGMLLWKDGVLTFEDIGSSNGSFLVGGDRVDRPVDLGEGSIILIGESELRILEVDEDADEATQMLDVNQLRKLSGLPPGVPPTAVPEASPRMRAPPTQAPRSPAPTPAVAPSTMRRPVEDSALDYPRAPEDDYSRPPQDDYPRETLDDIGADDADDWVAQAAAAPVAAPRRSATPVAPESLDADSPAPAAPRPRNTGPKQAPAPIGDQTMASAVDTLKCAIQFSLDLVKGWKQTPTPGWPEIRSVLDGTRDTLEPHVKKAPLPYIAVAGAVAIFAILAQLVEALSFVHSIVSFAAMFANVFAAGTVSLYLIEATLGGTPDLKATAQKTLRDPKALLMSIVLASVLAGVGAIAVLLPGIMLGAFIWPVYWIEGRQQVGINQRSMELFLRDPKRVLLSGLTLFVGLGVLSSAIGWVLGMIPVVGVYLGILFAAVWAGISGAAVSSFTIWLYLDVRREFETGDVPSQARQKLPR